MQNEVPANDIDWDVIIIGSGFGGAVSALRMAEKGYRVLVVEQGRHISAQDMDAAATQARHLLRMPALGLRTGFFAQEVYRHIKAQQVAEQPVVEIDPRFVELPKA